MHQSKFLFAHSISAKCVQGLNQANNAVDLVSAFLERYAKPFKQIILPVNSRSTLNTINL